MHVFMHHKTTTAWHHLAISASRQLASPASSCHRHPGRYTRRVWAVVAHERRRHVTSQHLSARCRTATPASGHMGRPFQTFSQDNAADAQDAAAREEVLGSWKARLTDSSISVNADVDDFLKWFYSQQRVAYTMELQHAETPLDRTASKVGGLPFLLPGESWPTSRTSNAELTFVWQFRVEELPQAAQQVLGRQDGLFQFFLDEELYDDGDEGYYLARVLQASQLIESGSAQPSSVRLLTEKAVLGWTAVPDFPHPEDAIEMYTGPLDTGILYDIWEALDSLANCESDDKLLGWPNWCQGAEWATTVGYPPDIADTGRLTESELALGPQTRYTQFLQMGEQVEDGLTIGDAGTLLIQCHPTQPTEFKVSWACC